MMVRVVRERAWRAREKPRKSNHDYNLDKERQDKKQKNENDLGLWSSAGQLTCNCIIWVGCTLHAIGCSCRGWKPGSDLP